METGKLRLREVEALVRSGLARYQAPVTCGEIIEGSISLRFPSPQLTEVDMEVLRERVQEVLDQNAPYILGQVRGELPPRVPLRRPCGGTGS